MRETFQWSEPVREPTVRWAMIGSDPEGVEDCVVPLLRQPREQAPICFANGIDSVSVISPSLTAFLESFLVCLNAVTNVLGEGAVQFPDFDLHFDIFWWMTIHGLHVQDPAVIAAISEPLTRLNAADQSDHPVWSLRGPDEIILNDRRLLWPET